MHWSSSFVFLLFVVILFIAAVFLALVLLNREQRRYIRKYKYDGEKKYLELADLLPQIVFECDKDGKILFLNSNGLKALKLTRIDIQNGINISKLIIEGERQRFWDDFLYSREGGLNKGQEYFVSTYNQKQQRIPMMFYMSQILVDDKSIGVRGIVIDITEQKILEQKLLGAVIQTEDKERQRFSEDLHDGLGPLLSTIKLYFNQLHLREVTKSEKEALLKTTFDLLDEAIATTKAIANNILPGTISDYGLFAALKAFCNRIESTGIINFDLHNNLESRLSINIENTLYRIFIELVNNTLKHAHASLISISIIEHDDVIEISYSDDGIGLNWDEKHSGLGLENIKNRCKSIGANLSFNTKKSEGFRVLIVMEKL